VAEVVTLGLLSCMRVIVVEDSVVQSKIICRRLRSENRSWTVSSAATLDGVTELLRQQGAGLDLLLLDMNLGVSPQDGAMLLEALRSQFPRAMQDAMVVMMSKDCHERERMSCCANADGFWPKPLAPNDVLLAHLLHIATLKAHKVMCSEAATCTSR
jgi:CheY-like chemotaxis protein